MSRFNFLVFLNNNSDPTPSNNASLNNFKWTREINGLQNSESASQAFLLAPSENRVLFSGTRVLPQDNTTTYTISLKPFTQNIYRLDILTGPQVYFKTPRALGVDATTQITTSSNGQVLTFTSTAGTALDTTAVVVGDKLRLGSLFALVNQGEFTVISKTSNSVSVVNDLGASGNVVVLTSDFANQFQVYDSAGIQVGDKIVLSNGFSPASFGTYVIQTASVTYLEIYSTGVLPQESNVFANVTIYSDSKMFAYMESDSKVNLIINGNPAASLEPWVACSSTRPGVFMLKSTIFSLEVDNKSLNPANILLITVE